MAKLGLPSQAPTRAYTLAMVIVLMAFSLGFYAGSQPRFHRLALPNDGSNQAPLSHNKLQPQIAADPLAGSHSPGMDSAPVSPQTKRETVFRALLSYLEKAGPEGDYVETGVWRGASAAIVASHLVCRNQTKMKMWLYDAWQGMPATIPEDGLDAKKLHEAGWGKEGGAVEPSSLDDALAALRATGIDVDAGVIIRKGWFNETFPLEKPPRVAFLHIDSDWYQSVMDSLLTFYDLVPIGGVVLFDDFGAWEGCRRAVWDFFAARGEHPLLERMGYEQVYFIKGKEHNRKSGATGLSLSALEPQMTC